VRAYHFGFFDSVQVDIAQTHRVISRLESFISFIQLPCFKKNGVQEPITRTPPTRQPKSAPPTNVVFTSVAACRNQLPNTSSPPGPGSKTAWQMLNIIQALPIHAEIGGQKAQLFQIFFGEGLSLPQRACAPTHSEAVLSRNPKSEIRFEKMQAPLIRHSGFGFLSDFGFIGDFGDSGSIWR